MADAVQVVADSQIVVINELEERQWAVISFDRCEAGNLTYEAAAQLFSELEARGVTGLCVVTDQTAARLAT